ncbi:integrase family protein [Bradyrhizobium elkanii]|uniref:tyrosine-type recombinase/integrase n=1 Tax=Bradyrhizobium TaxID=374 RepID=UPI00271217D2|nr:integrase family protein [Bradyrhizobium elkanii]WLA39488.1 integrase family protein [Bradyrhizobium elkanii]
MGDQKLKATRHETKITDNYAEALTEFADAPDIAPGEEMPTTIGLYPDKVVAGLFLYVGPRKTVWRYRQRRTTRDKSGKRPTTAKVIGRFPEVGVVEARKKALAYASAVANDQVPPAKRQAVAFQAAWDAYLAYLLAKANERRKPARHHANATKLGDKIILPKWARWTLADMAQAPGEVEEWHAKISRTHGPVSANRACELIRAAYKHRAKRDVALSLDRLPTSSVQWNKEEPAQLAIAANGWRAWRAAWDKLESGVHRGYFLFCLLSGVRPGEGARIRLQDIDTKARTFTIPNAKAGKDITLPLTREMAYAISLAVNAPAPSGKIVMKGLKGMKRGERKLVDRKVPHHEITDPDFVFPGCRQMPSRSGLPIAGNALRHTFKTLHVELGIPDMLSHFLMGHALEGVSAKYIAELIIANGPALREAQEKVSRRVFELLGLSLSGNSA